MMEVTLAGALVAFLHGAAFFLLVEVYLDRPQKHTSH